MKSLLLSISLAIVIAGCMPEQKESDYTNLPYPANEDILYYQSECDSGYQTFWTDIKLVTSAYLNNSKYDSIGVKPDDIIIKGEGLFTGYIEVEMPEIILELKLQRPNKSVGARSIWQVIEAKEIPWPKPDSLSVK
jgi:hypothetical protein